MSQPTRSLEEGLSSGSQIPPALQELDRRLLETVETLRHLCVIITKYQNAHERTWFEKLNEFLGHLDGLKDLDIPRDILIPWDVIDQVDKGRNPDLFLEELMESSLSEAAKSEEKKVIFSSLKEELEAALAESFPEEIEEYMKVTKKEE